MAHLALLGEDPLGSLCKMFSGRLSGKNWKADSAGFPKIE